MRLSNCERRVQEEQAASTLSVSPAVPAGASLADGGWASLLKSVVGGLLGPEQASDPATPPSPGAPHAATSPAHPLARPSLAAGAPAIAGEVSLWQRAGAGQLMPKESEGTGGDRAWLGGTHSQKSSLQ
jgi:hypothetical protein